MKDRIPFVITPDRQIYVDKKMDENAKDPHSLICQKYGIDEKKALRLIYLKDRVSPCAFGIDGLKLSPIYNVVDYPFPVKVGHLKVIESRIKKLDKGRQRQ